MIIYNLNEVKELFILANVWSVNQAPMFSTITVGALGVSAKLPSPTDGNLEDKINSIGWVVRCPEATFWYRAEGDCLEDAGVLDGDLIACDRSGKKRIGRIMLFVVDGAFTAKTLNKRSGQNWLEPMLRAAIGLSPTGIYGLPLVVCGRRAGRRHN